jgi:hypothetical protein
MQARACPTFARDRATGSLGEHGPEYWADAHLDEFTELPDGTLVELVSTDDLLNNGGDLFDTEERAALYREFEGLNRRARGR